jgi:teichuronic acid biosynthesis glycosyltransferase TuaG
VTHGPLVSIVTPAYNAAAFITQTIRSVQAQTHAAWELHVVDDCSPDETRAIVRRLAADDTRIHLIEQPSNGGPARARQAALDAARGKYIAFVDADDCWLPEKLGRQLEFMRRENAAISYTEYRRVSADGSRVGRLVRVPSRLRYRDLLCNTAIATSTVLLDRDRTGPFSMTETYYDDYALWLSILRRGLVAQGLHEDLMRYRVVTDSWSRNKANSARWVWRMYRDVERLSISRSAWCFGNYAYRAVMKYRRF